MWLDKISILEVIWIKIWNFEKMCKGLFEKIEDSSYIENSYGIIGKLIFIKVL